MIKHATDRVRERYIEIIDTAGGKLISVVEFVSPTNKLPGEGRDKYLDKQQDVAAANVNLVEIDLTRRGKRTLSLPEENLPAHLRATYLVCVYRGQGYDQHEIYSMPLRQRLPVIRIPLRADDADIVLDIQALVDQAYQEGRYDDID